MTAARERGGSSWVVVRPLSASDAQACDGIVAGLPYHFGDEDGRRQCARAVREQAGLVACDSEGEVVGFVTFSLHFEDSAEITWMAVRADRRRRGVGGTLIEHLSGELRAGGRRLLLVFTVSPSDEGPEPEDGYGATRRFYERMGFLLARDVPELWPGDTAVLMIRALGDVGRLTAARSPAAP
jgi:ribosomal protein S18 acetylase RimI-like enzyme